MDTQLLFILCVLFSAFAGTISQVSKNITNISQIFKNVSISVFIGVIIFLWSCNKDFEWNKTLLLSGLSGFIGEPFLYFILDGVGISFNKNKEGQDEK